MFATRSPFRPNPIGLSCVKLERLELRETDGPVLLVTGGDLMDGTPVYDIKPYLAYVDAYPEARGGFAEKVRKYRLEVDIPEKWLQVMPEDKREVLRKILEQDPRPAYQEEPDRVYGMEFAGVEVKFRVEDGKLLVCEIYRLPDKKEMEKESIRGGRQSGIYNCK